jgi:hypothetical protein
MINLFSGLFLTYKQKLLISDEGLFGWACFTILAPGSKSTQSSIQMMVGCELS